MKKVTSKVGTIIAYDRSGDGPPIILVNGAFSHRAINSAAQDMIALLAPQFTVISYDRRGRGDSTDTTAYAVEREVEDLHVLIDEVLVIAGEKSEPFMHNAAKAIADTLPNARSYTLQGQDHDVAAEALAPVLQQFFAG
jgi:pimeloyl-ACP methyl ester carboxylesterase